MAVIKLVSYEETPMIYGEVSVGTPVYIIRDDGTMVDRALAIPDNGRCLGCIFRARSGKYRQWFCPQNASDGVTPCNDGFIYVDYDKALEELL